MQEARKHAINDFYFEECIRGDRDPDVIFLTIVAHFIHLKDASGWITNQANRVTAVGPQILKGPPKPPIHCVPIIWYNFAQVQYQLYLTVSWGPVGALCSNLVVSP